MAFVALFLSPVSIAHGVRGGVNACLPVTRPRIGIVPAVTGRGGDQTAGDLTKPCQSLARGSGLLGTGRHQGFEKGCFPVSPARPRW